MRTSPRILLLVMGVAGVLQAAEAPPKITVYNLTIGTNKIVRTSQRMAKCEVQGVENCRIKCEENGSQIELFPYKSGKTTIWVYEAMEKRLIEEIRVNVCSKDIISLYDQAADRYRGVDGLVIDIENDKLVFSGEIFSMQAYQELTSLAQQGKYSVQLKLHPYVNAVLAEPTSDLGPLPGQEMEDADEARIKAESAGGIPSAAPDAAPATPGATAPTAPPAGGATPDPPGGATPPAATPATPTAPSAPSVTGALGAPPADARPTPTPTAEARPTPTGGPTTP